MGCLHQRMRGGCFRWVIRENSSCTKAGASQPGNEVLGRVFHAQGKYGQEPCRREELSSSDGWKQVNDESWEVSLERSAGPCMGAWGCRNQCGLHCAPPV